MKIVDKVWCDLVDYLVDLIKKIVLDLTLNKKIYDRLFLVVVVGSVLWQENYRQEYNLNWSWFVGFALIVVDVIWCLFD